MSSTIEKSNLTKLEFFRLSKHDQRVLIAKDVLMHLKNKKLISHPGSYFEFVGIGSIGDGYLSTLENAKQFFETQGNCCHVCAKGAAVCAYVMRFNERTLGQMCSYDHEVVDIFGEPLWQFLESIYEGFSWNLPFSISEQAERYYRNNLEGIMRNIVRNKGKFVISGKVIYQ